MSRIISLANKVWNDFDVVEVKNLFRRLFQVMRNCGDAVRLDDTVARDRQIRTVGADQSNVGSMECGNDGQIPFWFERFAREDAADRVRDGVVYVKQIQILGLRHRGHLGCERQSVWLVLEERIRHHLHFMKAHALVKLREAGRQGGRDEVDCVAACCQLLAQFRADDATPAVSWINRYANVHLRGSQLSVVSCDSLSQSSGCKVTDQMQLTTNH